VPFVTVWPDPVTLDAGATLMNAPMLPIVQGSGSHWPLTPLARQAGGTGRPFGN
jgi:hypothetical protein